MKLKPKLVECVEGYNGYDLIAPEGHMLEIRGGIFAPTLLMADVHINVLSNDEVAKLRMEHADDE